MLVVAESQRIFEWFPAEILMADFGFSETQTKRR
jgi:hypothetical protein